MFTETQSLAPNEAKFGTQRDKVRYSTSTSRARADRLQVKNHRDLKYVTVLLVPQMTDFLLDDIFEITAVDPDGKKFDKVSRIQARSDNYDMLVLLDVNFELYPLQKGQKFTLVLTKSITLDSTGAPMDADEAWRPSAGPTLADKYEYVMYGRVFKFEDISSSKMAAYVSYGGLLMRLEADPRHFIDITIGSNIYLLMRKI